MNTLNNRSNLEKFLNGLTTPEEEQELLNKGEGAEHSIIQAGQKYRSHGLSDDRFAEMINMVEDTHNKKIRNFRLQFYSIAASIALFIGVAGFLGIKHFENTMQVQYAQGNKALQQVAYYLNKAQTPLQNIEYVNQTFDNMKQIEKGENQLKKMEYVKYYPVK